MIVPSEVVNQPSSRSLRSAFTTASRESPHHCANSVWVIRSSMCTDDSWSDLP